ncbi:MAG: methyltransferase domain-containing protein [Solirubrobacterales bacterium]|nr:methyltransferase domain-containing protein [Solirubrobacterales bacterium]
MKTALLDVLAAPGDRSALTICDERRENGEVLEGSLIAQDGRRFEIRDGVPRMAPELQSADEQSDTRTTFGSKWQTISDEERDRLSVFQYRWFEQRFGFGDEDGLAAELQGARWVIDAGTGPGIQAARLARVTDAQVLGMDLSESVVRARRSFAAERANLDYIQGDILDPPLRRGSFDLVVADQVLHHTPDCRRAFHSMAELVRPGGQLATYVYRIKPLLREIADEEVRKLTTRLSVDECMEFSEQVTELGRELSGLDAKVTLEKGIPLLGLEPGEHDVQRLIYWTFFKCFWNEELGEGVSNLVNFDWYHPPYASRHTEEEVLGWCRDAGLEVINLDVIESGISLRARRLG